MVKTPPLLQAAGSIPGSRAGYEQRRNKPKADVDLGKAGERETDPECAESQCCSAEEGFLPQPEDGEAQPHRTLLYGKASKAVQMCRGEGVDRYEMSRSNTLLLS